MIQFLKPKSIGVITLLSLFFLVVSDLYGQTDAGLNDRNLTELEFTVEEAPEWTELFHRFKGWIGADGIFAIPMNGTRNVQATDETETALIFSDTLIGEISDGQLRPGLAMVNNTIAYLKGNKADAGAIRFEWADNEEGRPVSLFTPDLPASQDGDYYWLGDGFVNTELDSSMYIFAYRMRNLDPEQEWSFSEMSTDLIVLPRGSKTPFNSQRQIETPLRFDEGGFGAGLFLNTKAAGAPDPDGFVYVYGVRGEDKHLMIARVKPKDFETFDVWTFWDGSGWSSDMQNTSNVVPHVSNELSVSALPDGRYALVFTLNGLSPVVGLRLAPTPYGPFGPVIQLYETDVMQRENYIAYNAKAYPNLSAPGELLISYNVNAFDFFNEISANPNLYRPRFIRVKFQ